MRVLLIKDVASLGKAGEIKEVKDGYGHNFLIAKGLAKHATNEVINKYKAEQKRQAELEALQIAEAKQMQQALEKIELTIPKKVGTNNHLFGSLTKDEISSELQAQHRISIDKKAFEIPQIKMLGKFQVIVKLGHGLQAKLNLNVIAE
ncbi:50S ribosomal protein L9 [Helicobacter trogontum]|uniref:Large ribosomal subunit protein bL9 n=1 Tax=Helicobacter trogontum TaxID=50960 RepID=A0A099VP32_9HELI|nr:50S ribosomal protein L9 [Helicobacter trogontum]MCI5787237.1 50S ribosomal protein L9 [Helicobacter trogontum]MDY5185494.1 50S ribosomal protein L9 [Helicobacter trogontum]TLD83732.1 50S ribosomal protein L9 [Helicobacter trogontum]TLD99313.1 50S ribosomal protein L9 [Helicobacter trogontum]